jgi:hypothetical protein
MFPKVYFKMRNDETIRGLHSKFHANSGIFGVFTWFVPTLWKNILCLPSGRLNLVQLDAEVLGRKECDCYMKF